MIVRVPVLEVIRELLALRVRVGVLLAQVPDDPEVMAEAGDQLAVSRPSPLTFMVRK
jgi:hypothetical protein